MYLDRDVITLTKSQSRNIPPCRSHMNNSASSNGQSNCKENGGYPANFRPQQEPPVDTSNG